MKICETCAGMGFDRKTTHGRPVKVLCGPCHGTGLINLGHESDARYAILQQRAQAKAIRDGWYEYVWEGPKGDAVKVLKPITAPAVRHSA